MMLQHYFLYVCKFYSYNLICKVKDEVRLKKYVAAIKENDSSCVDK